MSGCSAVLDQVLLELRALRQLIEAGRAESRLSRGDHDHLGAILPVVAAKVGSSPFLVRELLRVESAALRLVLAGLSAKALGRLLRRAEGQPVNGLVVEHVGVEAGAVLWRVVKVVSVVSEPVKPPRTLGTDPARR